MPDQPTAPGEGEGAGAGKGKGKGASNDEGEWVALASGLEMGNANQVADVKAELLAEWLLGEAGDEEVRWAAFDCSVSPPTSQRELILVCALECRTRNKQSRSLVSSSPATL